MLVGCVAGTVPRVWQILDHRTRSSRRGDKFRDADEVVGGDGEREHPPTSGGAAVAGLAQAADRLDPAEDLLDPLAYPLADRVAGMARRAPVDRRATPAVFCATCGVTRWRACWRRSPGVS